MIGRGGGWQVMLADLALILFMVSASALDRPEPNEPPPEAALQVPQMGEPVAIWRDEPGASPLQQWLADQQHDARLQLTIVARGERRVERALALLGKAPGARLVVEPGESGEAPGIFAVLAYDQAWHDACVSAEDAKGSTPCA